MKVIDCCVEQLEGSVADGFTFVVLLLERSEVNLTDLGEPQSRLQWQEELSLCDVRNERCR